MNLHDTIIKLMKLPQIKAITKAIRKEYKEMDWGWTCGGCFAFAEAISASLPESELWAVGQKEPEDWASQHAVVKYNNEFYDAKGKQTEKSLLNNYGIGKGKVKLGSVLEWIDAEFPNSLWYPEQEFVTEEEMKLISKEFCTLAGIKKLPKTVCFTG